MWSQVSNLHKFYIATQNADESVATLGHIIEEILQKAVDKRHIK